MAKSMIRILLLASLAVGCASVSQQRRPSESTARVVGNAENRVMPVGYAPVTELATEPEVIAAQKLSQPTTLVEPLAEPLPGVESLSLPVFEELAVANNPTLAQAQARLRALQGKWVQVGLPPNPTVGYIASEIGADGGAGQQGGFAGQEFVTAKKLLRNRAIVCAEIKAAEQRLAIIIQRVQTDVRLRYYNALLAQQRVELAKDLVRIATEAAQTSKALIEAEEIPLAGLLQTEVQLENAKLLQRTSENGFDQAWRQLHTLLGSEWLPPQALEGDVTALPAALDYQEQLAQVQLASPELAAAMAEVQRSRRVLNRQCVEAVPNVNAQVSVQHDDSTGETLTGIQVGIPLPIWNRNQGGIRQARSEVTQAARNVDRVELNLQRRLVDAFRQYADARMSVETYAEEILTRSKRTLELVRQGYAQGEVGYLDLLSAQRTFSQTNLAYLDALGNLWQNHLRIDGLLLEGSLETNIQ